MTANLHTVRDFFRFAVTEFTCADLQFGHGAINAVDEAAFIVLEALSLPIDDINPWLDARLTGAERARLIDLIEQRVATRKPAAYLLGKAYVQGVPFFVDERVIVPRSFIGEILGEASGALPQTAAAILDLCAGSACLAILAAMAYPDAEVDAVDLSAEALAVARRNLTMHGLEDRVALFEGDLFAPLAGRKYDLILSNPPYVDAAAVAAFPPEYRAEPLMAHLGGDDGLDIVRRILRAAPLHLNAGGVLVCEVGRGGALLQAEFPDMPFVWMDTAESDGEVFRLAAEDFR